MFGFLNDYGNYEARKVGRDNFDWGFVSSCRVSDGAKPYETAVKHSRYRSDGMVIVEAYETKEEALAGHKKWVKKMTGKKLPAKLVDCNNSELGQLIEALGGDNEYPLLDKASGGEANG